MAQPSFRTAADPSKMNVGEPYCGACGHSLVGCVDSARCPECGRPIIETLMRGGDRGKWGPRYTSEATLFGLPVLSIAFGATATERFGRAKGIIALGDKATGFIAIGGQARGFVALGGVAMGGVTFGGVSLGLFSGTGGVATGALASGGCAAGLLSFGGFSFGYSAWGGMAIGRYAAGGVAMGEHTISSAGSSQVAQQFFNDLAWYYGSSTIANMIQPVLIQFGLILVVATIIAVFARFAHAGHQRRKSFDEARGRVG
jgi:hypothetical protein